MMQSQRSFDLHIGIDYLDRETPATSTSPRMGSATSSSATFAVTSAGKRQNVTVNLPLSSASKAWTR